MWSPVSGCAGLGRVVGAEAGALSIMASGRPAALAAAQPALSAMAETVYRLGERAGIGSTVKMVNQLLAGVHIAAAAEAMALGVRAGADAETCSVSSRIARAPPGCSRIACRT